MVRLSEIWMRDPFLLSTRDAVDLSAGAEAGVGLPRAAARPLFWLYGTTDAPPAGVGPYSEFPATGFECYSSDDLVEWRGPVQCFRRPEGFWADTQFWAPEVHLFEGRLVMLATMKRKGKAAHRGVAVLESPSGHPEGPFVPLTRGPVTPNDWSCLDGTLMVENGVPYMVFCHEWTQVGDGLMMGMELRRDLRTAVGAPFRLFAASEAPWVKPFNSSSSSHASNLITDGPFLFRSRGSGNSTELLMLWSSIGTNGHYSVGVARSPGGSVRGPWTHDPQPLFAADGGHAMVARLGLSLGGKAGAPPQHTLAVLALHSPNRKVTESAPRLLGLIEELDAATGCAKLGLFDFLV